MPRGHVVWVTWSILHFLAIITSLEWLKLVFNFGKYYVRSIVMSMSACLSTVSTRAYSKTIRPNLPFLRMLPVAVDWSSSDGVVNLRYVMYIRFYGWRHVFISCGQWARIKHDVMFRRVCQVAVPVGHQSDNYGGCFSLTKWAPGGVKSTMWNLLSTIALLVSG